MFGQELVKLTVMDTIFTGNIRIKKNKKKLLRTSNPKRTTNSEPSKKEFLLLFNGKCPNVHTHRLDGIVDEVNPLGHFNYLDTNVVSLQWFRSSLETSCALYSSG